MVDRIAVLTVAFYTERFSRVFMGSFRKHYPDALLMVVDNNMMKTKETEITKMGRRESAYLAEVNNTDFKLLLLQNPGRNKSHGIGLDCGMKALKEMGIEMAITVDIDSVFLKPGLINKCIELYTKGYRIGGSVQVKGREGSYVHPSLAFYDVSIAVGQSFEDEARRKTLSTGERLCRYFEEFNRYPFPPREMEGYVHHFCGGSSLRLGANFCRHKLSGSRERARKLGDYFNREDVKWFI